MLRMTESVAPPERRPVSARDLSDDAEIGERLDALLAELQPRSE